MRRARMRTTAIAAAPVAVILVLTWFTGLIYRVDYPENPAVPVPDMDAPAIDLATVQRNWPSGVEGGSLERDRLAGFMQRIEFAPVAATAAAPVKREPELDIGTRLARADMGAGKLGTRGCASCHTFERGGPNRIGPDLWGVVGRPVASAPGFAYSRALAAQSGAWTYEQLDRWIASPARAVPGNKMSFAGLRNAQDRANVIAYLSSLSDRPLPFPPPQPAATAALRPAKS